MKKLTLLALLIFSILLLFTLFKYKKSKKNLSINTIKQERKYKKMQKISEYQVKEELKPQNLENISNEQINDHWKLYQGYVKNVNQLNQELIEQKENNLMFSDRRRRYGFEYNGMILHEYYFENLTSNKIQLSENSKLKKAIEETWGSLENWKQDFINTGKTRGIGWAILYADPTTGQLTNNFISEHQDGIITRFIPILVMDVWEHAYMVDHRAGGRADYIEAFFKNINWNIVENRYKI